MIVYGFLTTIRVLTILSCVWNFMLALEMVGTIIVDILITWLVFIIAITVLGVRVVYCTLEKRFQNYFYLDLILTACSIYYFSYLQ